MAIRVGLYVDREDWVLGTIAHQIQKVYRQSGKFVFHLTSWRHFMESPKREMHILRGCDVIHWLSPHDYSRLVYLFPKVRHICTINHCLPEDDNKPHRFQNTQILTISNISMEELLSRGFSQVTVIYEGVDNTIFKPMDREQCRQVLGIQTTRPLIGFFGKGSSNPQDRKGSKTLIAAALLLGKLHPIAILISGEDWGGLIRELESVGTEVFRRHVQEVEEMPLLYGALDAYVCTSKVEGGPVTLLEAMACERPVVTTPVGHVPELIRDRENGLVVPIDNPKATAHALEDILYDPKWAHQMAKSGRETVLENWIWEKSLGPLGDIYQKVVASDLVRKISVLETFDAYFKLFVRSIRYRMNFTQQ
jgi:glycosyltransferase involved in cell wall biosynthesis